MYVSSPYYYFFSSCTDVLIPTGSVLWFVVFTEATGDFLLNNRDLFLVKESIVIETGTLILLNNSYVISRVANQLHVEK